MKKGFGKLLTKEIKSIPNNREVNLLFKNTTNQIKNLGINDSELNVAMEHLRTLTNQLQTKQIRNKIKSESKYFTL